MSMSDHKRMPEPVRRLEVFTGGGRRRSWSCEEKAAIVAESYAAGETVSAVARRHGLTAQQLSETVNWDFTPPTVTSVGAPNVTNTTVSFATQQ